MADLEEIRHHQPETEWFVSPSDQFCPRCRRRPIRYGRRDANGGTLPLLERSYGWQSLCQFCANLLFPSTATQAEEEFLRPSARCEEEEEYIHVEEGFQCEWPNHLDYERNGAYCENIAHWAFREVYPSSPIVSEKWAKNEKPHFLCDVHYAQLPKEKMSTLTSSSAKCFAAARTISPLKAYPLFTYFYEFFCCSLISLGRVRGDWKKTLTAQVIKIVRRKGVLEEVQQSRLAFATAMRAVYLAEKEG